MQFEAEPHPRLKKQDDEQPPITASVANIPPALAQESRFERPDWPVSSRFDDVDEWLHKYYGSHEKLGQLLSFADETGDLENEDFLTLLGRAWSRFDNVGIHRDWLFGTLQTRVLDIESTIPEMMDPGEKAAFEILPEQLTIYRGCGPRNKFGFSWSLNREIASKFPFGPRYGTDQPTLLAATISKGRAAALKLNRNEHEVIVFYDPDEPSIHWTEEPILRDPAGKLIHQA